LLHLLRFGIPNEKNQAIILGNQLLRLVLNQRFHLVNCNIGLLNHTAFKTVTAIHIAYCAVCIGTATLSVFLQRHNGRFSGAPFAPA
jgi:hypothetical protein